MVSLTHIACNVTRSHKTQEFLTFGLFLTFGAVGMKKGFLAARNVNPTELRAKATAAIPKCMRGMCPSSGGDLHTDDAASYVTNPLRDTSSAGDIEMHGTALSVETPSTPVPAPSRLPDGWIVHVAENGKPYYSNKVTNETTWTAPTNAK